MNSNQTRVEHCSLIELPRIQSDTGSLTPITNSADIDFDTKRIYYLYDVPGGEARGGHAHKALHQLLVAASGSFTVTLFDGEKEVEYHLNRSYKGLRIVPGIWREIHNFSSGAICLVLASEYYDENDYIRDIELFKNYKGQ